MIVRNGGRSGESGPSAGGWEASGGQDHSWETLQLTVVERALVRPDGTRYDGPFKHKPTTRKP